MNMDMTLVLSCGQLISLVICLKVPLTLQPWVLREKILQRRNTTGNLSPQHGHDSSEKSPGLSSPVRILTERGSE